MTKTLRHAVIVCGFTILWVCSDFLFLFLVNNFTDADYYSRSFQEEGENRKVTGAILRKMSVKSKLQCAKYCTQDNTCTQFSYHGDVLGNNCLLGSATSGEKSTDDWVTFST